MHENVGLPKKLERNFRKRIIYPMMNECHSFYRKNFYPKIFANSIPKSGTHLVAQILSNMKFNRNTSVGDIRYWMTIEELEQRITPLERGDYLLGHEYFNEDFNNILEKNKIDHILIVRNPKDVVVSKAFYISKTPAQTFFSYYNRMAFRERFIATIKGLPGLPEGTTPEEKYGDLGIAEVYKKYLPWLNNNACHVIKFEDLIGSPGGGSDEKQLDVLRQLLKYIGVSFNETKLRKIASNSFNKNSSTFRKGQIGDWANWLDDEMLSILKKDENIFKEYGYSI